MVPRLCLLISLCVLVTTSVDLTLLELQAEGGGGEGGGLDLLGLSAVLLGLEKGNSDGVT